ncbi:MAG: polysaccharide deacetylase family protein [Phycisphaerae bacterium]|nr:polysaccharide deacetylase family protein [Phycisphaerae bacterium]
MSPSSILDLAAPARCVPLADIDPWTAAGVVVFMVVPLLAVLEVLRYVYLEYRRDRVPVLLYHRLISHAAAEQGLVPDKEMIWVSYDTRFAEQMQYLRDAGYVTLDFDDYLRVRAGEMPLPAKPVIVTFDDGYLSTYTMGFPVLKRLGQKGVVFVSLEPDEHTRNLVKGVDGFLSPDQMREMAGSGMSIQSHTVTHCILADLADEVALRELEESRRRIAEITGRPVEHIAIPRAGYSRRIKRLTRMAGYRTACCNNKGSVNGWSDLLALPRIVVERDMSVADFARCLSPRGALMLRITGNMKRIPERLGGGRFAARVRKILYRGPLLPLFETRNLKRAIAAGGLLYLLGSVLFFWSLLVR